MLTAKCIYDSEAYKALMRSRFTNGKNPTRHAVVLLVVCALLGALMLFMGLFYDTVYIWGGALYALLIALVIWSYFFSYRVAHRGVMKQANGIPTNTYICHDHEIEIHNMAGAYTADVRQPYSSIVSIRETNRYVMLFVNKQACYILDKTTIENGNIETLRQGLRRACPNAKYIIQNL